MTKTIYYLMYTNEGEAVLIPSTEVDRVRREAWKRDSAEAIERRKRNGQPLTAPVGTAR